MFVVVLILGIILLYMAAKGQKSARIIFGVTGVFDVILGLYGIITKFM